MSDSFKHNKLERRIKDMLNDAEYSMFHDMLKKLFPEIAENNNEELFNSKYSIGDLFVRKTIDDKVLSILYISYVPGTDWGETKPVSMINLITGGWWTKIIKIPSNTSVLTKDQFQELIGTLLPSNFIKIGCFGHNNALAYIKTFGDEIIHLHDLNYKR